MNQGGQESQQLELSAEAIAAAAASGDYRGVFPDTRHLLAQDLAGQQLQQQQQQPQQGRKLMGRYETVDQLEAHARQMQSERDQLLNGVPGTLYRLAEQHPEIYDFAEALANGQDPATLLNQQGAGGGNGAQRQQQGFSVKVDDVMKDDGFGGKSIDPEKLVGLINKAVEHGQTIATQVARQSAPQGVSPQLSQAVARLALQQQYLQNGIPISDLDADMQTASALAGLSEAELIQVARQIRLGNTGGGQQQQQFPSAGIPVFQGQRPLPPQPVTLMGGGNGGRPVTRQQQQARAMIDAGGKTQRSLFAKRT